MLQVQGISVEVGGRLVVENASFSVMPRDKVGQLSLMGARFFAKGPLAISYILSGGKPFGGSNPAYSARFNRYSSFTHFCSVDKKL